jgi:Mlc titration factor MtfA (ptsG expression regulator)
VDAGGIHHEWEEVLSGESWELGPVVLSWADVEVSGMGDGYNVVIHEMAHKLDMRNGDADGFPPLHRNMRTSVWTRDFSDAFQHLQQNVERGVEPPLDHYAGETPAEFFAVSSEYFFEQPWVLWEEYPRVYEQLRQFYQQDPHARWRERSGPSSISGGKP